MLRNHFGWARRFWIVVSLLVLFTCSAVGGAPVIGISASGDYQAQTSSSISGYVYVDAAKHGVMYPGEWGLAGVTIYLNEYSANDPSTIIGTFSTATAANGYYSFTGLSTDNLYTVTEVQPTNYNSTGNSVGNFLSATGATLTAPDGIGGVPANGRQDPNNPYAISSILLPASTGDFAPSGDSVYSAINYNFGQFPQTPIGGGGSAKFSKLSLGPSVPASDAVTVPVGQVTASLAIVGGNNRFLAGHGAGSVAMSVTVQNSAAAGSSAIDWQVSSLSPGLSVASTAGTSLMPLNKSTFAASIDGTSLNPGTQNATLVVSGQVTGGGSLVPSSTTSAVIDPVYSRGIDSVSTVSFGRIMQGAQVSSSFVVTSTGSHDSYNDLTMNAVSVAGSNADGSFIGTNSSPVHFDGTTVTSSPAVAITATFSTSASGPVSGNVTLPGNSGLFVGETLAAGTPTLPSLSVPYTATVIQPRSLQAVTGGTADALMVPTTGGGLLSGAVVSFPASYLVTSTNANPDSDHTSTVNVAGQTVNGISTVDGKTQVGTVTASQTKFNSGGLQAIGLTVEVNSFGPTSGSASLNVTSAEAEAVHDTTAYAPLPVFFYFPNIGFAATGGTDPKQGFGASLSGGFAAGSHLSSRVAATGSAGTNSMATGYDGTTLSQQSTVNASNVTGAVGSQCDIIASTTMSDSALVTMAWRGRNSSENGSAFVNANHASAIVPNAAPPNVTTLTSDVVEIGGMPAGVAYALQMTYDDRINTYLNGSSGSATVGDAYLVKLVDDGNGGSKWEKAVLDNIASGSNAIEGWSGPLENVYDSKGNLVTEGFLETEYAKGYTLDQLAGSWGVDLANQRSWAVVDNGGGDFAVVPEPSTFALLSAAAVGLLTFRLRDRRSKLGC